MERIIQEGSPPYWKNVFDFTRISCCLATIRLIFVFTAVVHQANFIIDLKSNNYKNQALNILRNTSLSLKLKKKNTSDLDKYTYF